MFLVFVIDVVMETILTSQFLVVGVGVCVCVGGQVGAFAFENTRKQGHTYVKTKAWLHSTRTKRFTIFGAISI